MNNTFPILSNHRGLIAKDFSRFSKSYAEILRKRLPTAKTIYFSKNDSQFGNQPSAQQPHNDFAPLLNAVRKGGKSFAIQAQSLVLPFQVRDGGTVVAIIEGADPVFLDKVSEDWLEEIRAAAEREFILLKEARVDVQTGLLNLWNLYSLLDSCRRTSGLHLILIELPPKRTSFRYAVRYSQKCATLILNFVQGDSVLHFLGQSTFALVLPNRKEDAKSELESTLVAYLKREGCCKVHIGSSFSQFKESENDIKPQERNLLDEAWTALRHAEKRGPFSFCDYNRLAYPENHPFVSPERNLFRRLSKLSRQSQAFCLVYFKKLGGEKSAKEIVLPLLGRGKLVNTGRDSVVYLDGFTAAAALSWTQEVIRRAGDADADNHISAGICCYPYSDFKKTEMPVNCCKALLHASFFGESSAVVFDAVSLNISGDIYFADGDLAKAVREYKRGLKIDTNNINLHNSLGVALAMVDKLVPAMQSFENALVIDKHNFMALYNLGLAEQTRGNKEAAYEFFEKALFNYKDEDKDEHAGFGLLDDLKLQLGMLAGDLGKYHSALEYLEAWQKNNKQTVRVGRAFYHTGKAYHGIGDNNRAMSALQRALQFFEFDDRAMDLLGTLYLQEGEGDDIALALCRKSVELEPGNIFYRCNLAAAQVQCGMHSEARENLYRCLKNGRTRAKAQLLLGRSYCREGLHKRAGRWFEKVLKDESVMPELHMEAGIGMGEASTY